MQEVGSVVNTTFLLDGSNEVITMFSDGVAFVLNILSYEVCTIFFYISISKISFPNIVTIYEGIKTLLKAELFCPFWKN